MGKLYLECMAGSLTYSYRDGFFIDVTWNHQEDQNGKSFLGSYLYHKSFGIKMFLLGCYETSIEGFVEKLETDPEVEIGIQLYRQRYMPD